MSTRDVIERDGELQLQRRGSHYEIISRGVFLMATYDGASERLLARAALDACAAPRRVLIGGLGVGFSLAQVVADPRVEEITVVEVEPAVIRWQREHLGACSDHACRDPRVRVVQADFVA